MKDFSHLDPHGNVRMVDVTDKQTSLRVARAEGKIFLAPETIHKIKDDALPKGNVFTTAKVAGVQAAKKTADLIPMCHQLNLSYVDLEFEISKNQITITSLVKTKEATGVEMEALTAVSIAALTLWDMVKAIDTSLSIEGITLIEKRKEELT